MIMFYSTKPYTPVKKIAYLASVLALCASSQVFAAKVIVTFKEDAVINTLNYNPLDERFVEEDWRYINQKVAGLIQKTEKKSKFKVGHAFSKVKRGFAADLTPQQIAELKKNQDIALIEDDLPVKANAQNLPWGIKNIGADVSTTLAGNGSGVVLGPKVYVIDSGITKSHLDLKVSNYLGFIRTRDKYDCNGHGTHVAGTIAGIDNSLDVVGVAPQVYIAGLKVLDCNGSGSTSGVIKGIDWVTANGLKPAIINMSLGGGVSSAMKTAVANAVKAGVTVVVAAGNSAKDACLASPADSGIIDGAITVGAIDINNQEASFSNYGQCVDIWAPGVNVLSTKLGGGSVSYSGTSMASPHVAGAAALYLAKYPTATPAQVEAALKLDQILTNTVSKDGRAIAIANVRNY